MGSKRRTWAWSVAIVLAIGAFAAWFARPPSTALGMSQKNSAPAPQLAQTPNLRPLRIVVFGGTKGTGRAVAELAAARGHSVIAAARRAPEIPFSNDSIAFVRCDVADADTVAGLIEGQDAVVFSISTPPTREPVNVYSTGTANILAGMKATQSSRVIMVTGIGAGDSRGHGGTFYDKVLWPLILRTAYEDKDRAEALLQGSDTSWTIARPGFLTDEKITGEYYIVGDLTDVRSGSISRSDVAHFIVAALESGDYVRQRVLLTR
jgi:putative NADH-flavin reductase